MRGKKGPVPPVIETEKTEDPDIKEIIGEENIVDVGDALAGMPEQQPAERQGYKCIEGGCTFRSNFLSEMTEHCNGTGHGGYLAEPTEPTGTRAISQPELFSESGAVHRMVNVMLPAELLNEKRTRLAALYQSSLEIKDEKKATDDDCNARLKNLDTQMQEIARVLRTPYTYEKVDCEWRIIDGENARGLYRIDTGELIEKSALTEEDRAAELQRAEEANRNTETVTANA